MIWWSNPSYDKIKPHKLKNYKLFTPISLAGIKGGYKSKGDVVFEFLKK